MPTYDDTVRLVAQTIEYALRNKLSLSEQQVYVSSGLVYVPGPEKQIQIAPGALQLEGSGHGGWEGGALLRRQYYALHLWYRQKLDMHGWTREATIEAGDGILSFSQQVRTIFGHTFLQLYTDDTHTATYYPIIEPVRYEGESPIMMHDPDRGILYRTITISCAFGEVAPSVETVLAADTVAPVET